MQPFFKTVSSVLLLFNGIGALYGGWNLMLHPDGSSIQLSQDWLQHTPFNDYFIPGIILFVANGLFSFFALASILFNFSNPPFIVMAQGCILLGWIVIQILMIQTVYFLHIIMGGTGLLLILFGWLQWKVNPATSDQVAHK